MCTSVHKYAYTHVCNTHWCANKWCTCPSGQGALSPSLIPPQQRTEVYAACLAHTHNNALTKSPRILKEKRGQRRGKEEEDRKGKRWGEGGLEEEERGTSTLCVKSQPFTHGSSFYSLSDTRRWMVSSSLQTCGNRCSERLKGLLQVGQLLRAKRPAG